MGVGWHDLHYFNHCCQLATRHCLLCCTATSIQYLPALSHCWSDRVCGILPSTLIRSAPFCSVDEWTRFDGTISRERCTVLHCTVRTWSTPDNRPTLTCSIDEWPDRYSFVPSSVYLTFTLSPVLRDLLSHLYSFSFHLSFSLSLSLFLCLRDFRHSGSVLRGRHGACSGLPASKRNRVQRPQTRELSHRQGRIPETNWFRICKGNFLRQLFGRAIYGSAITFFANRSLVNLIWSSVMDWNVSCSTWCNRPSACLSSSLSASQSGCLSVCLSVSISTLKPHALATVWPPLNSSDLPYITPFHIRWTDHNRRGEDVHSVRHSWVSRTRTSAR